MSVSQAQACINSAEYSEWLAWDKVDHWSVNKIENMLAVVCSIIANVNRGKNVKAYSPSDFLPIYDEPSKATGQDMEIKLRALLHGNNQ